MAAVVAAPIRNECDENVAAGNPLYSMPLFTMVPNLYLVIKIMPYEQKKASPPFGRISKYRKAAFTGQISELTSGTEIVHPSPL